MTYERHYSETRLSFCLAEFAYAIAPRSYTVNGMAREHEAFCVIASQGEKALWADDERISPDAETRAAIRGRERCLMTSERNRPLCKEDHCGVEIHAGEKYCAAHSWRVASWLAKSRELLERISDETRH